MNKLTSNQKIPSFIICLELVFQQYLSAKLSLIQRDIAQFIECGPRFRMVQAFRGIGKSQMSCVYALWRLLCNPQMRVLIVSASQYKAIDLSLNMLKMIESCDVFTVLRPVANKLHRRRSSAFDVGKSGYAKDPSVVSLGIASQMTGSRAHLILADDVEIPSNAQSGHQRQKLMHQVLEFVDILFPGGEMVYLGTPQCIDSLYYKLQQHGVCVRVWPAEFPKHLHHYYNAQGKQSLGDFIVNNHTQDVIGSPTDPDRFSIEELKQKRLSRGRFGYAMQYLLSVHEQSQLEYPLRRSCISVLEASADKLLAPIELSLSKRKLESYDTPLFSYAHVPTNAQWIHFDDCILSIDPAGSGPDSTAVCVIGLSYNRFFLLDILCLQERLLEGSLRQIVNLAMEYRVSSIIIEANFGQDLLSLLLNPLFPPGFQPQLISKRVHQNKQWRIGKILEPILDNHRLSFAYRVVEKEVKLDLLHRLSYQICNYSPSKKTLRFDDLLDSLVQGLNYLSKQRITSPAMLRNTNDSVVSIWDYDTATGSTWSSDIFDY